MTHKPAAHHAPQTYLRTQHNAADTKSSKPVQTHPRIRSISHSEQNTSTRDLRTTNSLLFRVIKVREMPLRHFTSFLSFFSGHWVQGSPLPPTAQVMVICAIRPDRPRLWYTKPHEGTARRYSHT